MQSIHEIASDIVAREGGFVNDPDDPGGATKHGVTIHTMRRLGLDLDGDGDVDVSDVRKLSRDRATEIFIDHYFHRSKISQLPEVLQASFFDMNVNAGANSVKILQRLVHCLGFRIGVDGQIGPQTISAVRQASQSAPDHIGDAYGIERRNYYYALGDRRNRSRKYARRRDWGQRGLDRARRRIHRLKISFNRRRTSCAGGIMGLIERVFEAIFGGGRNVVRETAEVFWENREAGAVCAAQRLADALEQYAAEFSVPSKGKFDRVMDVLNRLPRPALALGTLGLGTK